MAARKLMHAVQYNGYGGGPAELQHVEIPIPIPQQDEVLIKLEATSINPFDWKVQKGMLWPLFPRKFPYIPGQDLAGEVVEVGSGIQNFKPNDKVIAMLDPFQGGELAEYAVAKESLVAKRPSEVSAHEGSGIPVAGLTDHYALTQCAGIKLNGSGPKRNLLITAASGGVGLYAAQLSKLGNTHVTATCGARNIEFVRSLGADEVIDYKTQDGANLKSPSGKKYDAVINCASCIAWSTFEPNLSDYGKVIEVTPRSSTMIRVALKKLTLSRKQLVPLFLDAKVENIEYLVMLVNQGKLKVVIDSKYSLSKVEDAWAKSIEVHATGKMTVEP